MSLAETQELMATMKELMALLQGVEAKTKNIIEDLPQTEHALRNFKQLERVALRYLVIARQLGLPDDIEQAIQLIAKLLIIIRMVQMSLVSFTGGPLGIASGAASVMLAGLAASSMLEGY